MTRTEAVARAAERWAKDLTDVSGRNRLLYYRPLRVGTLDLAKAEAAALKRLLGGKPGSKVALSAMFPSESDGGDESLHEAVRRARAISRKATENFEERGVGTLFLVQGMATWTNETSRALPAAPVLMCTVGLHRRGAAEADFDLSFNGEWTVNDALMRFLAKEFEVSVSGEELLGSKLSDAQLDDDEVAEIFDALLAETVGRVPGFRIERHRLVIGNFMYRKMPMVSDIEDNIEELAGNDIIAAIAGDGGAREALRQDHTCEIHPSEPNRTPPADEYLVLDADSSQNQAINAALAGESFVLQGPPGTGKSQTIANVIATMMARGQSVLFVAEKRAAIDAVTKRLTTVGLDGFVMDYHGGTLRRRELARRLNESLVVIGQTPPVDQPDLHKRLERLRAELAGYAEALHREREPWGVSYFDIQARLLALRSSETTLEATPKRMFTEEVIRRLDRHAVGDVRFALAEWAQVWDRLVSRRSPWLDALVTTATDVRRVREVLAELSEALPDADARCRALLDGVNAAAPTSIAKWTEMIALLADVDDVCEFLAPTIFERDLGELARDLALARRGRMAVGSQLLSLRYRAARRDVRRLWQGAAKLGAREALDLIEKARDCADRWASIGGSGSPSAPTGLADVARGQAEACRLIEELQTLLDLDRLAERTHAGVADFVDRLVANQQDLDRLRRLAELEQGLVDAGVEKPLQLVRSGSLVPGELVDHFDRGWLASVREEIHLADSRLAGFVGELHALFVDEFRADDVSHLESNPGRIRRKVAERAIESSNEHLDQNDLIRKEASKKTRHLPLRQLFEKAPDVLTAVWPCWAMSPLDVAQTLPPRPLFDLVIFDEASQVLPCDAVPALLRAPRAMVAGDARQLPPTTFFDGAADDDDDLEEDTGSLADYESLLDRMDAMLSRRPLTWHYRSADERLITFSNRNIYNGLLTTFPGADVEGCLGLELVEHRRGEAVNTRSNSGEVRRVVDLMVEHARRRPGESLGVIAMGRYHADRIEADLRQRLGERGSTELEEFFDESLPERAFVKNLERVQGDERDAIILSVGYGKTADGRLLYRFGPLNQQGGERRLNVAVTRARRRMTLVSSFSHAEMDPEKTSAEGVRLLREYLRFAESGGADLSGADRAEPLNAFEVDVRDKLTAAGLSVVPQYGFSGYRIDFAVHHPDDRRRFVLAVEADGASYHSSRTARDRDRLRQEHLERLGWRFCRIWSTDWFNDHPREVHRVLEAVGTAVKEIDSGRTGPAVSGRDRRTVGSQELRSGSTDGGRAVTGVAVTNGGNDRAAGGARAELIEPAPTLSQRGPAPRIRRGLDIDEYNDDLLERLAEWVISDQLLRTDEEIFEEMFREMGYRRRGHRIRAALYRAIEQAKRRASGA